MGFSAGKPGWEAPLAAELERWKAECELEVGLKDHFA